MPDLYDIRGCSLLDYYCAQDWNSLVPTNDPGLKFCTECQKNVKFCKTYEEFEEMAEIGHCVAFLSFTHEEIEEMKKQPVTMPMGLPKRKSSTD